MKEQTYVHVLIIYIYIYSSICICICICIYIYTYKIIYIHIFVCVVSSDTSAETGADYKGLVATVRMVSVLGVFVSVWRMVRSPCLQGRGSDP